MGTSGSNAKDFLIAGINTSGYTGLVLSFGLKAENTSSPAITISVSTDGTNYTALSYTHPTNTSWTWITATGIPAAPNLRIRFQKNNSSGYRIDDVQVSGNLPPGGLVNFATPTSSASEGAGMATITMPINPTPSAAGTISISITGGTATYGADFSTTPNAVANVITLTVPAGATSASFSVNIVDDAIPESDETIQFTLTGATGGLFIGPASVHVFTIIDNDFVASASFATTSVSALEGAGPQVFTINLTTPHPSGNLTIQITNGPGAVYGTDYTTNPPGNTGTFTIPFSSAATSISFTASPLIDGIAEPTETVTFTIIAISNGIVIGPNASATLHIGDIDSPPTELIPGDLVVVGVSANEAACSGSIGEDRVSFFAFKDIAYGTEIIITDNGYERCNNPGHWGNQEGTVKMRRTGGAIPAGQVITFKITGIAGSGNIVAMAPDAHWTCTNLNTPSGGGGISAVNMNTNGDQLFFMHDGVWNSGTNNNSDATYTGTVLYAFSTNPTYPWSATCPSPAANQRSNLPPGVECFSTSPTLASDFNKYKGPITAATQRDWIIRIENPTNWSSFANCTEYNSLGYNWLTAPILPIIPGGMTHGLWRGTVNMDWFECKNWDDARIPDALTNVVINSTATNNCNVGISPGLNPGGTADCATITQTITTTPRVLNVRDNSTLNVGGLYKVQNQSTSDIVNTVMTSATLNAGSVELSGNTNKVTLNAAYNNALLNIAGNLNIGPMATLNLQPAPGQTAYMRLGGDFINSGPETQFLEIRSDVLLNGSGAQHILNTDPNEKFSVLRINKPSGDVTLGNPIAVSTNLDLVRGRVFSSNAALPTLLANSTATNASNLSFVHGPLKRIGNTDFTFPIGKGNYYRPASLSGITGSIAVGYTAEYFAQSAQDDIGWDHDWPAIHHVSDCEYWRIDRSAGTPNARVTLTWDTPASCGVDNLPELRTAYWNGTLWIDRGAANLTGTNASGSIATTAVESSFAQAANYWTLASVSRNNPLPIELLSFTAYPQGQHVRLEWSTASELNNERFTVERSADGMLFSAVLSVPGARNSIDVLQYSALDTAPLQGMGYYRLRQTDLDGRTEVSDVVPVFFGGRPAELTVLYGPGQLLLEHRMPEGSELQIVEPTGRVVAKTIIGQQALAQLPMEGLAHGLYIVRVQHGAEVRSTRFVY